MDRIFTEELLMGKDALEKKGLLCVFDIPKIFIEYWHDNKAVTCMDELEFYHVPILCFRGKKIRGEYTVMSNPVYELSTSLGIGDCWTMSRYFYQLLVFIGK